MFEKLIAAPADPILGLTDTFRNDPRTHKINLGVGIYKDEAGQTPVLRCVKKAEARLVAEQTTKNYLSIEGVAAYATVVQKLLFGEQASIITEQRARTAQSPGGTGALRIAGEFIARQLQGKTIWVSNPTWANHKAVFNACGLETKEYGYYNADTKDLDFDAMLSSLAQVKAGEVVLLHGCCHNPTGIDPTPAQWEQLAKLSAEKGWLPLFDFAYQGFGKSIDEDAYGLRVFAEHNVELLIASSFSKNFGMYNERVGAFTLVAKDADTANTSFSQVKTIIRAIYSNPPAHGANVIAMIAEDPALYADWLAELAEMRERIQEMRTLFVEKLASRGVKTDFSFIARQNGMFSFSGLNKDQVTRLKDEFAIYIVGSGRISVAGITKSNIDALCDGIAAVI